MTQNHAQNHARPLRFFTNPVLSLPPSSKSSLVHPNDLGWTRELFDGLIAKFLAHSAFWGFLGGLGGAWWRGGPPVLYLSATPVRISRSSANHGGTLRLGGERNRCQGRRLRFRAVLELWGALGRFGALSRSSANHEGTLRLGGSRPSKIAAYPRVSRKLVRGRASSRVQGGPPSTTP